MAKNMGFHLNFLERNENMVAKKNLQKRGSQKLPATGLPLEDKEPR